MLFFLDHLRRPYSQARKMARGFSLVESTVILVIIGLVVATIWVAAAALQEKRRITSMTTNMWTIIRGARILYDLSGFPTSGANNRNSELISAGLIPLDMISGSNILSPWGTSITIAQSYRPGQYGSAPTPDVWTFSISSLSKATCKNLIVSATRTLTRNDNLVHIQLSDGSNQQIYTIPVLVSHTGCTDNNNDGVINTVGFFFAAR